MPVVSILPRTPSRKFALFDRGFRPFFLLAMLYAAVSILLWGYTWVHGEVLAAPGVIPTYWHAHEMIFGFAGAVIAGFLLTAVTNWTGRTTATGAPLVALSALWLAGRILPYAGTQVAFIAGGISDVLFSLGLFIATARPVLLERQWVQAGIISKLLLLALCNVAFYVGALGGLDDGGRTGLYAAFYLVLALVFTLARRVVPFFIQGAVGSGFEPVNHRWVDVASLLLFVVFAVTELIAPLSAIGGVFASALFFIHAYRLLGWHHPDIWRQPLLWILFLAYLWLVLAFALHALAVFAGSNPYLALHAFAFGGIGMVTIGMMTRVALGHTGRNVFTPPGTLRWIFALLGIGAVTRVLLPMFIPGLYVWWISVSMLLWAVAFAWVFWLYLPMLLAPRVDGAPG